MRWPLLHSMLVMLNCPLVLGNMADSPSGPWLCSIVSSATSSDADSASAYFSSSFLRGHHQDCTVTTCHVLYITCSLLSSRGGRPYLVMFDYARRKTCFYFSAFIQRSRVCCLQHIALNRRIHCLKHWLRLMDINVRAGQSQEE